MKSGKTLLSDQLHHECGYNHIQTDHLILSLQKAFPSLGVGKRGASFDALCDAFHPFLDELLIQLSHDEERKYIVEGFYMRTTDFSNLGTAFHTIFLGYPSATVEQKFSQIREHGRNHRCYSNDLPDAYLREQISEWIEQSKNLAIFCEELRLPFFDTNLGFKAAADHLKGIISLTSNLKRDNHERLDQ